MIEALWSVQFKSNSNIIGTGVAVFETGRVFGGDSVMIYTGSYEIKDGRVTANLSVKAYAQPQNMVSAVGLNQFNLNVMGDIARDKLILTGQVVEDPSKILIIEATRQAELP